MLDTAEESIILWSSDRQFKAEFVPLTPLEWLDIDFEEIGSSINYAIEVAASVTDWNGQGKIDAYELYSDKKNHKYIFQIWQKLNQLRELPTLQVEELPDLIRVYNDYFFCELENLTILEFIQIVDSQRKKFKTELPSIFKTKSLVSVLINWDSEKNKAALFDLLYNNKQNHKYIVAVDLALSEFFRNDETAIFEYRTILDSGDDYRGDDDKQPRKLEPKNGKNKGFSTPLERL